MNVGLFLYGGKNMKKISTRDLIMSGLFVAIGILLPMVFHSFNMLGKIFLPMHIPVLLAGFFLSPPVALAIGMIVPLMSSVLTGMPLLFPMAIIMMFELGSYGFLVACMKEKVRSTYVVLASAMLIGRVIAGLVVFVLSTWFGVKLNAMLFIKGSVMTGLPGIVLQLLMVPIIVKGIRRVLK